MAPVVTSPHLASRQDLFTGANRSIAYDTFYKDSVAVACPFYVVDLQVSLSYSLESINEKLKRRAGHALNARCRELSSEWKTKKGIDFST